MASARALRCSAIASTSARAAVADFLAGLERDIQQRGLGIGLSRATRRRGSRMRTRSSTIEMVPWRRRLPAVRASRRPARRALSTPDARARIRLATATPIRGSPPARGNARGSLQCAGVRDRYVCNGRAGVRAANPPCRHSSRAAQIAPREAHRIAPPRRAPSADVRRIRVKSARRRSVARQTAPTPPAVSARARRRRAKSQSF